MSGETDDALRRTPLYELHKELGAKLVPFAGYEMPVQYPMGILQEHLHTRAKAGLFDVSHMGQARIHGADAAAALETVVPADVKGLGVGKQRYALFTTPSGGLYDDLMLTNAGDHIFMVVNAGCKEADFARLEAAIGSRVRIEQLPDHALLAIQGPSAVAIASKLIAGVEKLVFMTGGSFAWNGTPLFVTRSGYTGEDGLEISVPAAQSVALARALLADPDVKPIGLGARDSLRLEAGLCLYGHDIDESTTPVEAGLVWSIAPERRAKGGFPGEQTIVREIANGPSRRRVGILPEGRAPAREGTEIVDPATGAAIGKITSGGFSPTLNRPIAMGYVARAHAAVGSKLHLMVRGKALPADVVKMPFAPHRYHRG